MARQRSVQAPLLDTQAIAVRLERRRCARVPRDFAVDLLKLWRTVAIVQYGGNEDLTHEVVEQSFREPVDVLVVDTRGDYQPIAREMTLKPSRRLDWIEARNYGWSYAIGGEWENFVLVNSDVQLSTGFFSGLVTAAEQTRAGIIVPTRNGALSRQHPSGSVSLTGFESIPNGRHQRIGCGDGTCMLITRETVGRVGLYNPTLFAQCTCDVEGDYCIRAKRRGIAIYRTEAAYYEPFNHVMVNEKADLPYQSNIGEELHPFPALVDRENWDRDIEALDLATDIAIRHDISVITATRHRPEALLRCCEQLSRQTLGGLTVEHIIISDGPDHRAQEIAMASGARFFVSQRPNGWRRGEAWARDIGMLHASGDYLVFWDDDNEYNDSCLHTLHQTAMLGHDVGVCQTVHRDPGMPERVIPESAERMFDFKHIDTMCLCVRREVALHVRWADCLGAVGSDFIWVRGLRQAGANFAFKPVVVGVHAQARGDVK